MSDDDGYDGAFSTMFSLDYDYDSPRALTGARLGPFGAVRVSTSGLMALCSLQLLIDASCLEGHEAFVGDMAWTGCVYLYIGSIPFPSITLLLHTSSMPERGDKTEQSGWAEISLC